MSIEMVDYQDGKQTLQAAVAMPAGTLEAPAVLVIHAWSGCGDGEHRCAERLAALGYVGIAIDVYGKGVVGDPRGDNSKLMAPWMADRAALRDRLLAGVMFARHHARVDARAIAAIGYCFGGLCALDLARGNAPGVLGVVSLHGDLAGNGLGSTTPIEAKVLVEHGWLDPLSPPDKLMGFGREMQERKADWLLHVHGRAMHSFTAPGANAPQQGFAYDADADRHSWDSTVAFLAELFERQPR